MPLFRMYKDIFESIKDGSKTIEVRNRFIKGNQAVFLCGKQVIRKDIIETKQFNLSDGFLTKNWKKIVPTAENAEAARKRLLEIFPNETSFYAYFIE